MYDDLHRNGYCQLHPSKPIDKLAKNANMAKPGLFLLPLCPPFDANALILAGFYTLAYFSMVTVA